MKEIFQQLFTIWRGRNAFQKAGSLAVIILVTAVLVFLLFKTPSSKFVPLFPGKSLSVSERDEIRLYLEQFSIPYQENKEKNLLVPSEKIEQIRLVLAQSGVTKQETGKGFELFDTNTWIKGERELQVLEMRALKGQLEKDLAAFEHIKSARVNLDIPPQKNFNGSKYTAKASVILTLMPTARLTASELRAITHHLAGAVRGLEPHMIAISDTTGKLYKAIDPEGSSEMYKETCLLFEEQLEEKISRLLTRIVGADHFHATIQTLFDKNTQEPSAISIAVIIDKNALMEQENGSFQNEIVRQIAACVSGYGIHVEPVVDVIPFERQVKKNEIRQKSSNTLGIFLTLMIIAAALVACFPLLRRYKKKESASEETLLRVMTKVDLEKLADTISSEDPQTIALMLSYLEPTRAEQLIAAFDEEMQEKVLFHLSEMEKDT